MVNVFEQIFNAVSSVFRQTWSSIGTIFPGLIAALIVLAIGYLVGLLLKKLVVKLLRSVNIDDWIEEQNLNSAIANKDLSELAGSVVKWYIVVLFLAQAVELIKLDILKNFVFFLVQFIPILIAALLIVVLGLLFGRYVKNFLEIGSHPFRKTIALFIEVLIVFISIIMALQTIQTGTIDPSILTVAFTIGFSAVMYAIAFAIAIAVGIAFGFSFIDDARKVVDDLRKGINKESKK